METPGPPDVAREKELSLAAVEQREGEIAVQLRCELVARVFVNAGDAGSVGESVGRMRLVETAVERDGHS
jgi:hypothetical protein